MEKYNLTEQDVDSFDELFAKELSKDEFVLLQTRLEADEIFRYKFQLYKRLIKEIESEGESNELLKSRFKRLDLQQKSKRKFNWISLPIAASLLMVATFFYLNSRKDNDVYNIAYREYQYSDPGLPLRMAGDTVSNLDNAMIAFNQRDYQHTLTTLDKCPPSDTVQYYKGLCMELTNEDEKAKKIYQSIQNSSSNFISNKANFRLLLTYIKHKDIRYKVMLNDIALDSVSPYQKSALNIKSILGKG
jgi:hypothetical protein